MNKLRFYHFTSRTIFVHVTDNGKPVDLSAFEILQVNIGGKYTFKNESLTVSDSRLRVDVSKQQIHTLFQKDWPVTVVLDDNEYKIATLVSDGFATQSQGKPKLTKNINLDLAHAETKETTTG